MKIVFISHPIGGDIHGNITRIRDIIRAINLTEPDLIPLAPYLGDVLALDDTIPSQRDRGMANCLSVMEALKESIYEVRQYGPKISPGMLAEQAKAIKLGLPVINLTGAVAPALPLAPYRKKYESDDELEKLAKDAPDVKALATLYYVNAERIEVNASLKQAFTARKEHLFTIQPAGIPRKG